MKTVRMLLVGMVAAVFLAACGGGGGEREFDGSGNESNSGDVTAPRPAARIDLTKSSSTISSDGRQVVRLFATVKDSGNSALAGVPVAFSASGTGVTLVPVDDGVTDSSGQAQAVLSISDPTLRVISVSGSAQSRKASTEITVVGTTVALSGPSAVSIGKSSSFTALLTDSSGNPVVGMPVRISSPPTGATLTFSRTDSQGRAEIVLAPSAAGELTLSVLAAGATAERAVRVGSTTVSFESPAALSEHVISPNTAPVWTPLVVQMLVDGVPPPAGTPIQVVATRGQTRASTVLTGADGRAVAEISSDRAGRSLVTATARDGTLDVRELYFIGRQPIKIQVQASPSAVRVNPPGTSFNSSQVIAVVRDAADNRIRNVRVNFATIDPSGGIGLSSAFAITDDSGIASVSFFPGPLPTGTNQIRITGQIDCVATTCAPGVVATDQTLLTAVKSAMQVRIGTGNEVYAVDAVYNELPYGVIVTDSAGNPVPGVKLSATVVNTGYKKGFYQYTMGSQSDSDFQALWRQFNSASSVSSTLIPVVVCRSEDINENLLLDPGEDLNRDGMLTPGNVAATYFGPTGDTVLGTSDDKGSAVMRVRYLRDRGGWVAVKVRVSALIPDGTEASETVEFWLPVRGDDLSDSSVSPPGQPSPYGIGYCP